MTQPRMKLPPQQRPTLRPAFYAGPTVSDVLDRLRAADVDEGLIEAYLREERRRAGVPGGVTWPQAMANIKAAIRNFLACHESVAGPYAQRSYALAGPSKGDCE